ncbi:MAG: hypothetical protein KAQ99_10190 [Candidatus Aureabacteria bacterium]|nr:hypothetical protein [Candidatus Auribacterota bacterium]
MSFKNFPHKWATPISKTAVKGVKYVCVQCQKKRTIQGLQLRAAGAGGTFYSCKAPCYYAIFQIEGEEEVFYLYPTKAEKRNPKETAFDKLHDWFFPEGSKGGVR